MAKPQRLSITLSDKVFNYIVKRSNLEGRSMSNLVSYILECQADEALARERGVTTSQGRTRSAAYVL
jgi:hypothetical protein